MFDESISWNFHTNPFPDLPINGQSWSDLCGSLAQCCWQMIKYPSPKDVVLLIHLHFPNPSFQVSILNSIPLCSSLLDRKHWCCIAEIFYNHTKKKRKLKFKGLPMLRERGMWGYNYIEMKYKNCNDRNERLNLVVDFPKNLFLLSSILLHSSCWWFFFFEIFFLCISCIIFNFSRIFFLQKYSRYYC